MEYLVSVHYAIETDVPLDEEKLRVAVMKKMVGNLRDYVFRDKHTVVVEVVSVLPEGADISALKPQAGPLV